MFPEQKSSHLCPPVDRGRRVAAGPLVVLDVGAAGVGLLPAALVPLEAAAVLEVAGEPVREAISLQ